MTTILIIYAVGVIINALAAASIWDDLKDEGRLVNVRLAVVMFFVLASFGTWVYGCIYFLVSLIKSLFTRKKKTDGDKPQV